VGNFLVLEFGSKSLKVHRRTSKGDFEKVTVRWDLGHEVYREGRISGASRSRVAEVVRRLEVKGFRPAAMLAIATGAVRDAEDREEFGAFVRDTVGINLRILSGREEASLLAQGFLEVSRERPALVLDIGGGSLETVYLDDDRTVLRDSLPLGAIRLHYLGAAAGGFDARLVEDHIDGILHEASVIQIPTLTGTGGPVKAVSKVLGTADMPLEALEALEEKVRREGPPDGLTEERKPIFLPGLMVLRQLMRHARAQVLRYLSIPIGRVFLERVLAGAQPGLSDSTNAKQIENIRITKIIPPRQGLGGSAPVSN
jgi:exopolyphosphatase/pppGpp-phosphohydrolase